MYTLYTSIIHQKRRPEGQPTKGHGGQTFQASDAQGRNLNGCCKGLRGMTDSGHYTWHSISFFHLHPPNCLREGPIAHLTERGSTSQGQHGLGACRPCPQLCSAHISPCEATLGSTHRPKGFVIFSCHPPCLFLFFVWTQSHCIVHANLDLSILLLQPPTSAGNIGKYFHLS